jgi:hypothetical protein
MKLNDRGSITIDVVFGLTITTGIMMIIFAFAYALSVAEVVQYIAFATSRTYYAANQTEDMQRQLALQKFNNLKSPGGAKGIAGLLNKNWIILQPSVSDFRQDYENTSQFIGARIQVNMLFLDFNTSVFGNTNSGSGFNAKINSFLGREPSSDECTQFFQQKWSHILNLKPQNATGAAYNTIGGGSDNLPLDDNGC